MKKFLEKLYLPPDNSHKGQNGKLLIIGGSQLFHAASKWSLDIASKIVDMVFYSSVPSNNKIFSKFLNNENKQLEEAKTNFWNGIVVEQKDIHYYIKEADAILIGPGMERNKITEKLVNKLLKKYPHKKWVIDAGALQMIKPSLLKTEHIITPHHQEIKILANKNPEFNPEKYQAQATCLLKGQVDTVLTKANKIKIPGGNAGMTKGGTGDVLAGLVAAFYCKNEAVASAVIASYINKKAGDELYKKVGPHFNASDLVEKIPEVLWSELAK